MAGDSAGARPVLGIVAIGCRGAFRGCSSGSTDNEAGLGKAAEEGVCSGDEGASAGCCAFALNVRSKQVTITQYTMRIGAPP